MTPTRRYQTPPNDPLHSATRKARSHLGPFLALMFAISILDRSNVGFAKDALRIDSHIGDSAFAFGAGIFFIGYAVFEVPSNLILHRVGAKIWLSRIMVTWGIASALMMFAHNEISFYILRFLVAVAEAGFSPGVILYSTYWFPKGERSRALGVYYMGLPAALALGSAISGALMEESQGFLGLRNWQWMFLVEGLAASIVGIIAFFYLDSKPRDAKWLSHDERDALEGALVLEGKTSVRHDPQHRFTALWNLQVARFIAIYFAIQIGIYGVIFYLPARIATLTGSEIGWRVGLLVAIPWLSALLALRPITGLADKVGKHRQFAISMLTLAVVGLAWSTQTERFLFVLLAFCVATIGFVVVQPIFWALPTAYLSGVAGAGGIALIGAFGNLGGFVAPSLKTAAEKSLHNQGAGMFSLACAGAVGVVLLMFVDNGARVTSATRSDARPIRTR
jgi:sugar phosphate permease